MTTKWYSSTMNSMSGLSNATGEILNILDACLLNGFGTVSVSSLVVSSNVATLTVGGGHGFLDYQIIEIAGATPSGLNGQWRFTYVSSTQGTFVTSGITDQTATGTITARTPPLGWSAPFAQNSQVGVYQNNAVQGTGHILQIYDVASTFPRARGYKTMTSLYNGTEPFPTDSQISGGTYFPKGSTSTPRAWFLVGDDMGFYFSCVSGGTAGIPVFFGDMRTIYGSSDPYCCLIHGCGSSSAVSSYMCYHSGSNSDYLWIARSFNGANDSSTKGYKVSAGGISGAAVSNLGNAVYYFTYPSNVSGAGLLTVRPVFVAENAGQMRGTIPGYVSLLNNCRTSFSDGQLVDVTDYPDKMMFLNDFTNGAIGVYLGNWT